MVRSRKEAVSIARAQVGKSNVVGTCQLNTRTIYGAPSVGDVDGDKDADAVDGWKSEPVSYRHGDRKPPAGVPVAWSGGRKGFGHRAVSLGPDKNGIYQIATIDAPISGKVGVVPLDWFEKHWNLSYLGWSDSISGQLIPTGEAEPSAEPVKDPVTGDQDGAKKKTKHGWRVARAIKLLESEQRNAKLPSHYRDYVRNAVTAAKKIPFTK